MTNLERLIFKLLERKWTHEAIHSMLDLTLGEVAVEDHIAKVGAMRQANGLTNH